MSVNVDVDKIADYMGRYVKMYSHVILDAARYGFVSKPHFTTLPTEVQEGGIIMIPKTDLGEVVQNFQAEFNEKGQFNISEESTVQRHHKINVPLIPEKLIGQWSGQQPINNQFLVDETKPPAKMNFPFFVMKKVIEQINHDREMKMLVTGKYKPAVAGQASPAQDTMDGIIEIMRKATVTQITYGDRRKLNVAKLEPFSMGAIGTAVGDTYKYIKDFKSRIPAIYRTLPLKVFASQDICDRYAEDKQEMSKFSGQFTDGMRIDNTNMTLHSKPGLAGYDLIYATAPSNLVRFIHKNDGATNIRLNDADPYKLRILGSWHEALGVAHWDYFWCNDRIPILP